MAKHYNQETKKASRIILRAVMVVLIVVMLFSGYKVVSSIIKYKRGENFDKKLNVEVVEVIKKENQQSTNSSSGSPSNNSGDITEETEIKIDFDILTEKNADTVGYIYSHGTQISYPIVHTTDNQYYVKHRFDGLYSSFGTIFIDYRQRADFSGKYTVLYGHNMDNGSMFAELLKYKKQDYYNEHSKMLLYTPEKKYNLEIFSAYVAAIDDLCYTTIRENSDISDLINHAQRNSYFESNVEVSGLDKIVMLSTCAYDFKNARFVVFGKLSEILN